MIDDGRDAARARGEMAPDPGAGIGRVDARRYGARHLDRSAQERQALQLIRPHVRLQREGAVVARRVEGIRVAAVARDHPHGDVAAWIRAREVARHADG